MKILLITLVITLVIILIIFSIVDSYHVNKLDKNLLDFFTGKDLVICGNSPEYSEQIKKVNISSNTVIVRFNDAIFHIPENSKTDVLILNVVHYRSFLFEYKKYMKYKKEQGIKYIFSSKQFLKYHRLLNDYYKCYTFKPTTGLLFIYFIIKHIDLINSVTLVGFNLLNTGHHWNKNIATAKVHDPIKEREIINNLVEEYSPKMVLIK
jgi:hypothetical protein